MGIEARQGAERPFGRARPAACGALAPRRRAPQRVMRVTVLGSGDAFGAGGRFHSAYLDRGRRRDVPARLRPEHPAGGEAASTWDLAKLDAVLLTHLHGDHFGGVPFLFMEYRYETPRTRPFAIYGPEGTERRVKALFAALYERTAAEPLPFPVEYHELAAGRAVALGEARVTALPVHHVPELTAFGYRVEVGGAHVPLLRRHGVDRRRSAAHARGVDLFVCECSTFETRLDIHVSYPEIAARAQRARLPPPRALASRQRAAPAARRAQARVRPGRDDAGSVSASPGVSTSDPRRSS